MPFDARQRYESNDIKKLICEKIGFTIVDIRRQHIYVMSSTILNISEIMITVYQSHTE